MSKRYYLAPDDSGAIETGGGPLGDSSVPEGYREVTAEEYAAVLEAGRQKADARAAKFIANDGGPAPEEGGNDGPA
ncbi:hypothetical protein VSR01_16210 [Actinacidiphila sp. DG2A-62]|uniref:hypothetical protein n=1 Tax=Actinacidiphila sp. DG2A-62 TaxID=3108821 RepID=UPI002DBC8493|nr:hypothetical protein [Actinacidiphila sp. DG2A-62]MEC3994989.1 hypothetical protein [Actinacidiphila sp. DG2A-62]